MEHAKIETDNKTYQSPQSWKNPQDHLRNLMTDPWYRTVSTLYSAILKASHNFFETKSIAPFLFPITTGSVSSPMGLGSDSMPVKVNIKNKDVFLADSMQFSLEVGVRLNENGAYYIMPTFRGEDVDSRHLNEFVHSEAEIPGTLSDVQNLIEEYTTYVIQYIYDNHTDVIEQVTGNIDHIQNFIQKRTENGFPKIRFEDAMSELKDITDAFEYDETLKYPKITSKGERELIKKYGDFVWLTNMPWEQVPFYQAKETDTDFSMTADLLAGIGEVLGCGQRVHTVTDLRESIAAHGVNYEGYKWYGEMRELRPMQTSGFGLGVERLILWLTCTDDIRDCQLLLRDHKEICFP